MLGRDIFSRSDTSSCFERLLVLVQINKHNEYLR